MTFTVIKKDKRSKARVGKIITPHGIIKTPSFVAVGTKGSVRSLSPQDLKETKTQLVFGNTYHLHLQPGEDIVKEFGGLAKFTQWNRPTITDSGGFQIFSLGKNKVGRLSHVSDDARLQNFKEQSLGSVSLSKSRLPSEPKPTFSSSESEQAPLEEIRLVKITEDGVEFRSHIDGSKHTFTPEISIQIQKKLGADLILAFDECAPYPSTHQYAKEAMIRTHNWALRSLKASQCKQFYPWKQALYGIIQGGVCKDLRIESAKFISNLPFDGIAVGGVSVGESKKQMRDVLQWIEPLLPEEKPRHLLGIGEVDDIFGAVENGMDTFDCVIPTRFGRYGIILVSPPEGNLNNKFRIDIRKAIFTKDKDSLSQDCNCYVCQIFSRGYISHLFKARELLAYRLASFHNLYFLNNLVEKIREAILDGGFEQMKKKWLL